jgi:hypothetical protein
MSMQLPSIQLFIGFYNSDYIGAYFESNFDLLQTSQLHNNKTKIATFIVWILMKSQLFVPVPKVSTHTMINIIVNTFALKLCFN